MRLPVSVSGAGCSESPPRREIFSRSLPRQASDFEGEENAPRLSRSQPADHGRRRADRHRALRRISRSSECRSTFFRKVGDPAIYVAQPYGGMDPAQMEGYLTYYYEYHFLYITGIDHVESKSIQGAALMKLVFHEGTDMSQAMAETVGYVNRARAFMPPGTVPPFITRFDAGSVAVGQLVFSSATHTQGELQDFALNRVRPLFATLPGVSAPPPFGGNQRTIVITLDPGQAAAISDLSG